jgi:CRP-like cAMP-binding protein
MLIEAYGYDSKNPHKLAYTLPRDDIANLVGTTYESVIRNLGKLDELKLIQLDNKSIIVPDENAIRKFIAKATIKSL